MRNPNSAGNRIKKGLRSRWSSEDYPGAEPRFQVTLLGKDVATFVLLPVIAVVAFKAAETNSSPSKRQARPVVTSRENLIQGTTKSQIIEFQSVVHGQSSLAGGVAKKAPGALVRLRLLNVIETYSNVPVHAQIVDEGLGKNLIGGTVIGDAVSDTNFERININFKFVRDPARTAVAIPIAARALSLDGTLGIEAVKKQGFFARSAIGAAGNGVQEAQGKGTNSTDLRDILFKALTSGLLQELGTSTQVEKNRAQVLTLAPGTEFFSELTDFFPGNSR